MKLRGQDDLAVGGVGVGGSSDVRHSMCKGPGGQGWWSGRGMGSPEGQNSLER